MGVRRSMSHKANYWLACLDPSAVKSGAFRVLFHLCDHHNAETDPRIACFPSQETLMAKTGLSNGALNNALNEMEKGGLLVRKRSTVPGTSQRRTYYILGCDVDLTAKQTPENGDSPNSSGLEAADELTPVSERANSILGPSKLQPTGEEPVITLLKEDDDDARDAQTFRGQILSACRVDPISGLTGYGGAMLGTLADMDAVSRWQSDLGLSESDILAVVQDVMSRRNDPPSRLTYFNRPMQEAAARRSSSQLEPLHSVASIPPQPAINDNVMQLLNERLGITSERTAP